MQTRCLQGRKNERLDGRASESQICERRRDCHAAGLSNSRRQTRIKIRNKAKGVAGKKCWERRTRFGGGGGTPKNLKFRANHKGTCELFWDPGFRGVPQRPQRRPWTSRARIVLPPPNRQNYHHPMRDSACPIVRSAAAVSGTHTTWSMCVLCRSGD